MDHRCYYRVDGCGRLQTFGALTRVALIVAFFLLKVAVAMVVASLPHPLTFVPLAATLLCLRSYGQVRTKWPYRRTWGTINLLFFSYYVTVAMMTLLSAPYCCCYADLLLSVEWTILSVTHATTLTTTIIIIKFWDSFHRTPPPTSAFVVIVIGVDVVITLMVTTSNDLPRRFPW
jgi:hypothetical protein